MLLVTENPPEALIEEARQHQRRRQRRQGIILGAAASLIALGFGIYQLAQGGNNVGATPPQAAGAAQIEPPTVTYEKIVIRRFVPHLPAETTTIETWTAPDGTSYRQVVRNNDGPRIEISTAPGTDKIYRAGYELPPLTKPPSPEQQFKRVIARQYVHLAGTTNYRGRKVYVLK